MQAVQQHPGQGQQAPKEPLRRRINDWLSRTVDRFRIALIVVIIAAAAFLVGYFVFTEVQKKVSYNSAVQAELVQDLRDKWQSESDATKKAALEKDMVAQLDSVVSRFPRQYGGQRALFIRAGFNYEKKDWEAARKDYETLAARFPKSYLAAISLFDAGVCAEEKGDVDAAQKLYVQVLTSYKDSTVAPRATFDAARMDESKGAWEAAQKRYESMDSLYSQSIWTKLAKDRLVQLKVMGKTK
jgi:TolA-binding protein